MVDMALELFWARTCGGHDQSMSCSVAVLSYMAVEKGLITKILCRPLYPMGRHEVVLPLRQIAKNRKLMD
jgi:hypothetical protein